MNKSNIFLNKLQNILYTAISAFKRNKDENLNEDIRPDVRETVKLIINHCRPLIEGNNFNEFFTMIDTYLNDLGIGARGKYGKWVSEALINSLYDVFDSSAIFSINSKSGEQELLDPSFNANVQAYYAMLTQIKVPPLAKNMRLSFTECPKLKVIDFTDAVNIEEIIIIGGYGHGKDLPSLDRIIFNQHDTYSKFKSITLAYINHISDLILPKALDNAKFAISNCISLSNIVFNDSPTNKGHISIVGCDNLKSVSIPTNYTNVVPYGPTAHAISSLQPNLACKLILEDIKQLRAIFKDQYDVDIFSDMQYHSYYRDGMKQFFDSVEFRDKASEGEFKRLRYSWYSQTGTNKESINEILKDTVGEDTLRKRRRYYLTHGITTSGLLESDTLGITTPYMLRIDGELLKCGDYHPYIKEYTAQKPSDAYNYLIIKHPEFLR